MKVATIVLTIVWLSVAKIVSGVPVIVEAVTRATVVVEIDLPPTSWIATVTV